MPSGTRRPRQLCRAHCIGKEDVVDVLRDKLSRDDLRHLRFAAKINIYGLGLLALWTAINTILLPGRVEETAPSAFRGSALGLISLVGVGIAALVQPFAGRVSDASQLPDRRRPFVIGGTIIAVLALVLFGWAPVFLWLLLGFVVLQVAANVGQAAFQAFIPDLVEEPQRGLASGVKSASSRAVVEPLSVVHGVARRIVPNATMISNASVKTLA